MTDRIVWYTFVVYNKDDHILSYTFVVYNVEL